VFYQTLKYSFTVLLGLLSAFFGQLAAQPDSLISLHNAARPVLSKTRNILILPLIARSIETDWSAGVAGSFTFRFNPADTSSRTSNAQVLALYSLRRQFIAAVNGATYFPGEQFILNYQISYSYFPDKFWGLGKVAPDESEEDYTFRQYYLYGHLQHKVRDRVFVGFQYEYQRLLNVDHAVGGLLDRQQVAGRDPYHISGAGLSLTYDSRANAFAPNQGSFYQILAIYFAPVLGSQFSYTNYTFDVRRYLPLYRQQVLALQAFAQFGVGDVPLRSLASFGGSNSMRGFYDGRYRSRNQIVVQAEYRIPLFWRIGAVGFAGIGNNGDRLVDLNFQDLKYSAGGGLRVALNRKERLNLRIDYGWGLGQSLSNGLYFQLGEAF